MSIVVIDSHMFGEAWFKEVVKDLLKSRKVQIAHSESRGFQQETGKKAAEFYKLAGAMKKRLDADERNLELHISMLEIDPNFSLRQECDDPHLFALLFVSNGRYLFTKDARLCRCRSHISKGRTRHYTRFKVLGNDSIYKKHRQKII